MGARVERGPGEPEEVAAGALFLTSDESSFISRTELAINGGTYR